MGDVTDCFQKRICCLVASEPKKYLTYAWIVSLILVFVVFIVACVTAANISKSGDAGKLVIKHTYLEEIPKIVLICILRFLLCYTGSLWRHVDIIVINCYKCNGNDSNVKSFNCTKYWWFPGGYIYNGSTNAYYFCNLHRAFAGLFLCG